MAPSHSTDLPVANPGRRLAAGMIDVILVTVAGMAYTAVVGTEQPKGQFSMTFNGRVVNDEGVWLFIAAALAYFFLAEAATGRTIGKALTGLRVVTSAGQRPESGAILVRTILRPLDGLPYILPNLLGFIVVASSARKQRIGDMVAGTLVVSGSVLPSPGDPPTAGHQGDEESATPPT